MNDESFCKLLKDADAVTLLPSLLPDLQPRVFRRLRRRRTVRRVAAVSAVALLLILLIRPEHRASPINHVTIAAPATQPSITSPNSYAMDALVSQKTADLILKLRREEATAPEPTLDPLKQFTLTKDDTAAALLSAGDFLSRDPACARQAALYYTRILTFFPGTPLAAVAGQRLQQHHS